MTWTLGVNWLGGEGGGAACVPVWGVVGSVTSTQLNSAFDLVKDGDLLYVCAALDDRLTVVDVSDPTTPTIVGSVQDATDMDGPVSLIQEADLLYIVGTGGLMIVDVSTPTAPSIVGAVSDPTDLSNPRGVTKDGDYCYIATENGITIVDVSTPASPSIVSALIHMGDDAVFIGGGKIVKDGDLIYVTFATGGGGLWVVDVADVNDPFYVAVVGGPTGETNNAGGLILDDGLFYVGVDDGLVIMDVPSTFMPVVGSVCSLGSAWGVQYDAGVCYVTASNSVHAIDVSTPSTPTILDTISDSTQLGSATGVVRNGNLLYVCANATNRLTVVDISTPTALAIVGSVTHAHLSSPIELEYNGGYCYVSCLGDRVTVVDVSTPSAPAVVGSVTAASLDFADGIAYDGGYCFVISPTFGSFTVVDVSTPSAPTVVASITHFTLQGAGVVYDGGYCYVSAGNVDRLTVVDVSTPTSPTIVGSVEHVVNLRGCQNPTKVGDFVYVGGQSAMGINVIDVSDPTDPVIVGTIGGYLEMFNANSTAYNAGLLYVASGFSGIGGGCLTIVDVTSPTSAELVSYYLQESSPAGTFNAAPGQIDKVGDRVYIAASGSSTVEMIDVSDPTTPFVVISVTGLTQLSGTRYLTVDGAFVYLTATTTDRVTVLEEVSASCAPDLSVVGSVASATFLDAAGGVAINGDYAYVASGTLDRLTVVDVTPSTAPTVVGSVTHSTELDGAQYVAYFDGYCYVTAAGRLTVVDISTPTAPAIVASLADSDLSGPGGIFLDAVAELVYVTQFSADALTVVDISTPTAPAILGNYADATNMFDARGVWVQSGLAYVGSGGNLTIVDVSNPASMSMVGTVQSFTELVGGLNVVRDGDYCYVSAFDSNAITVVDVSTPSTPTIVESSPLTGPFSIIKEGDVIYAAQPASDRITAINAADPLALAPITSLLANASLDVVQFIVKQGSLIYANSAGQDRLTVVETLCEPPSSGGGGVWTVG